MRHDRLYLQDILLAGEFIAEFLRDVFPAQFADSELLRSAVLQKLTIIGEAVSSLSAAARDSEPDTPWRAIVAFRNLAVHRYFRVDWEIVWTTATEQVPVLRPVIERMLTALRPDDGPAAP